MASGQQLKFDYGRGKVGCFQFGVGITKLSMLLLPSIEIVGKGQMWGGGDRWGKKGNSVILSTMKI